MSSGLDRITARRIWFVPEFKVWGVPGWADLDMLLIEYSGGTLPVYFQAITLEETAQDVSFSDLIDFRGNQLPAEIKNPRVIVRPRSDTTCYVVGEEGNTRFKVAHSSDGITSVTVDLLIIEMGD